MQNNGTESPTKPLTEPFLTELQGMLQAKAPPSLGQSAPLRPKRPPPLGLRRSAHLPMVRAKKVIFYYNFNTNLTPKMARVYYPPQGGGHANSASTQIENN